VSPDTQTIVEYIRQNRQLYTREAITSQLLTAGYAPADVEAAWQSLESGIPVPPPGYVGTTGLSSGNWDSGYQDQPRPRRLASSPQFWGYMVGFILLSYILPGVLFWLGASGSDGLIVNIAIGMFLLLQLAALVGGAVSFSRNRPRAIGLMSGVLMVLVVIPFCAFALFFGLCLASLGGLGVFGPGF
jgi:hypothetical protein